MKNNTSGLIYNRNILREILIKMNKEVEEFVFAASKEHDIDFAEHSKRNICAFLALKKFISPEIHAALASEGLSSIKEISRHVTYSLNKMINNLSPNSDHFFLNDIAGLKEANELKTQRKQMLFGTKKGDHNLPDIMITLDRAMLEYPQIFVELLRSGMTIARINCAHDDFDVWDKLITQIRTAEKSISSSDEHVPMCKIYMDLAGPKIRIAEYIKSKIPLIIPVKKENVDKILIGHVICSSSYDLEAEGSFVLHIDNCEDFTNVSKQEMITFTDVRGKDRILTVLEVVNPTCLKVRLNKTSILDERTILYYSNNQWTLKEFPEDNIKIEVKNGDLLRIYRSSKFLGKPKSSSTPASIGITLPKALNNVKSGDRIFFDDGKISAQVTRVQEDYIETKINGLQDDLMVLKSGKGINLPDSLVYLNVPALTEYDLQTLPRICHMADIIGLSFIHHPNDIRLLQQYLKILSPRKIGVVAKIETKDSVCHLTKIILEGLNLESFGIMIARGDLAVEVGFEQLAAIQEEILDIASAAHIPVIWATGVLEKMTKKGTPVRTELTDAYMGLRADCIMLNKGPHIVTSVNVIQSLNRLKHRNSFGLRDNFIQYGF
jgi:pyruvate kinase